MNGGKFVFMEKAQLQELAWNFVACKISCIYSEGAVLTPSVSMIYILLIP